MVKSCQIQTINANRQNLQVRFPSPLSHQRLGSWSMLRPCVYQLQLSLWYESSKSTHSWWWKFVNLRHWKLKHKNHSQSNWHAFKLAFPNPCEVAFKLCQWVTSSTAAVKNHARSRHAPLEIPHSIIQTTNRCTVDRTQQSTALLKVSGPNGESTWAIQPIQSLWLVQLNTCNNWDTPRHCENSIGTSPKSSSERFACCA